MDLSQYSVEFITIAIAHLFAVASPGPDFAIVMKHSIQYGKRAALITSVGVGTAILIHVAYALAGIGLIINSTPWIYDLLIVLASGFLLYLGWGAIQSKPVTNQSSASSLDQTTPTLNDRKAFAVGFLTNGLNPKATLFFLSLFTVVVSFETPLIVKAAYGVYLTLATMAWFCCLSLVLTISSVRGIFVRNGYIFDRVMGVILILLALNILYNEIVLPQLL